MPHLSLLLLVLMVMMMRLFANAAHSLKWAERDGANAASQASAPLEHVETTVSQLAPQVKPLELLLLGQDPRWDLQPNASAAPLIAPERSGLPVRSCVAPATPAPRHLPSRDPRLPEVRSAHRDKCHSR